MVEVLGMSVAQSKAAARRIKLRYPAPRTKRGAANESLAFMKKGQKLGKR